MFWVQPNIFPSYGGSNTSSSLVFFLLASSSSFPCLDGMEYEMQTFLGWGGKREIWKEGGANIAVTGCMMRKGGYGKRGKRERKAVCVHTHIHLGVWNTISAVYSSLPDGTVASYTNDFWTSGVSFCQSWKYGYTVLVCTAYVLWHKCSHFLRVRNGTCSVRTFWRLLCYYFFFLSSWSYCGTVPSFYDLGHKGRGGRKGDITRQTRRGIA